MYFTMSANFCVCTHRNEKVYLKKFGLSGTQCPDKLSGAVI